MDLAVAIRHISIVACLSLLLVPLSAPAAAEPQEGDVVATGHIVAGAPAEIMSLLLFGDPTSINGPHAFTFDATGLDGRWLWPQVHDGTGAGFVVLLHYLDADGRHLESDCRGAPGSTALATEPYGRLGVMTQCLAPPGTVTGFVTAWAGALLDVTVVVASAPPAPPAGVLAEGSVPLGAPSGQDSQWWLLGAHSPSTFSIRSNVTGLDGTHILTDVTDGFGYGYDVRHTYRAQNGVILDADCAPMPGASHPLFTGTPELRWSEACTVPSGAVLLDAHAEYGFGLHVRLRLP